VLVGDGTPMLRWGLGMNEVVAKVGKEIKMGFVNANLAKCSLLPAEHLVNTTCVVSEIVVMNHHLRQMDLVGQAQLGSSCKHRRR